MNTKAAMTILALLFVLSVVACNKPDKKPMTENENKLAHVEPNAGQMASDASLRKSNGVFLPVRYRFTKSEVDPTAESWGELLDLLPASDKNYLEKINANYFGAMEFNSNSELRKMAQLGIPLPREWLEAKSMTDEELKKMADAGNIKAQMFYADRLIDDAIAYLPVRKSNPAAYDNGPGAKAAMSAYVAVGQLKSSGSPFAAYQSGRMQYLLDVSASPEFVAGAMFAALDRGDVRAARLLQAFSKDHPGMDAAAIMSVYQSLKSSQHGT